MSIKKVLQSGIAVASVTLLVCAMPITSYAALGFVDESGNPVSQVLDEQTPSTTSSDAVTQDPAATATLDPSQIPQQDQNNVIGYNTRGNGFNVYGVGPNGEYIQSTYSDYGYGTYVNDTNATIDGSSTFQYGQTYERNGLATTIVPTLTDDSVNLEYQFTNNGTEPGTFTVGSSADTMIGRRDDAEIWGDASSFTMTDGTTAIRMDFEAENTLDNLWYGRYYDRNEHFNDNTVMTDHISGVDSGVVWGWNLNIDPGQTVIRRAISRIGDSEIIIPTKTAEVYQEHGPAPEAAPRVWRALTEKGEALPIQNMGTAEAQTYTLFIDISGTSTVQYKDVIRDAYAKAPANGVFVLGTSEVSVFDKEISEIFDTRKDVSIKVVFPYKDHVNQVNIPAGSNVGTALDDTGFAGFLKVGSVFGMTQIG